MGDVTEKEDRVVVYYLTDSQVNLPVVEGLATKCEYFRLAEFPTIRKKSGERATFRVSTINEPGEISIGSIGTGVVHVHPDDIDDFIRLLEIGREYQKMIQEKAEEQARQQ